ncbi:MAG: phosphatidylglycerophosphatase A [Pseudomonadales bacterium]
MNLPAAKLPKSDPLVIWASLLGVGWLPRAPGTWGSLAAVGLWWWLLADLAWWWQLLVIGVYFVTGWLSAALISRRYQIDDAGEIVADEVAGMWLALVWVPQSWWLVAIAFVLFRLLDVLKPGPIGWLDRNIHGGLGVMLDDLLAGVLVAGAMLGLLTVLGL